MKLASLNHSRSLLPRLIVAIVLSLLFSCQAWGQSAAEFIFDFGAGEDEILKREELTYESLRFPLPDSFREEYAYIQITGPAPFLLEAALVGPACEPAMEFQYVGFNFIASEPYRGRTFRRLYPVDQESQLDEGRHVVKLHLGFVDGRTAAVQGQDGSVLPNLPDGWACHLVARVSRNQVCNMWAEINGAVNRTYSGETAYFNTFENGVPITTGTIADPGMHEDLQNFAAGMADMVRAVQEMGYETPGIENLEESGEELPNTDVAMEQMRDEMFGEGGDTFGLTLVDVNSEAARQEVPEGSLVELAQGIEVLAGSFTLEASAAGGLEILEDPDQSIDLETGQGSSLITVPLSSLRVVPGGLDGELNRVPFVYTEGSRGSAILTIHYYNEDFIMGQVGGELFTESEYDGEHPSITVAATFGAGRGFKSCMGR